MEPINGLPWIDLASNRPGQSVLDHADQLYADWRQQPFFRRLLTRRDDRSWRLGAAGEELVARRLSKLGEAYQMLHSIPIGNRQSDIDHLVIGPSGVYTVNAKSHAGKNVWVRGDTVLINGQRVHHVRNSRFETERVARILSDLMGYAVPVSGLVLVVHEKHFAVREQPRDGLVRVMTPRAAVHWIQRRPDCLPFGQVMNVYEWARRSTTWREHSPRKAG